MPNCYRYQVLATNAQERKKLAAFCEEADAVEYSKRKSRDLKKELGKAAPNVEVLRISKGRPRSNEENVKKAVDDYLSRKGTRRKKTIPQICEKYSLSVATFNRRLKEQRQAK